MSFARPDDTGMDSDGPVLDFIEWLCTLQRGARAGATRRLLRPRPLQPVHLDRRRCSPTSIASIPLRRGARATATPASSASPRTARPTAMRPGFDLDVSCEQAVVAQLREMVARDGRRTRAASAGATTTLFSTPRRTRAWSRTPRPTTARCSARACRRGTCATGTWPRRWRALDDHLSRRARTTGADRHRATRNLPLGRLRSQPPSKPAARKPATRARIAHQRPDQRRCGSSRSSARSALR